MIYLSIYYFICNSFKHSTCSICSAVTFLSRWWLLLYTWFEKKKIIKYIHDRRFRFKNPYYRCYVLSVAFLYARLQTGRIMVWWCPSVRPGLRPSQFSAVFSYMLWHIDLKFCVSLYFYARKIKFQCHQFPSLFAGVMPLFNFKLFQICSFSHFSPTCFDILSSNFVYDFVFMYHRASLSVVILLQFLYELCLFVNLEYSKYTVFHAFLLHALTYWAEILHMTLFYCTTDQG